MLQKMEGGDKIIKNKYIKTNARHLGSGCSVHHNDYRQPHYSEYLKVARRVDLKSSQYKKKVCDYEVINVN